MRKLQAFLRGLMLLATLCIVVVTAVLYIISNAIKNTIFNSTIDLIVILGGKMLQKILPMILACSITMTGWSFLAPGDSKENTCCEKEIEYIEIQVPV